MIHDRDAHDDVLRILDEEGPPEQVVFHCFSGDAAMAKRCVDAGYVLSFAGTLTFKNAQPLREAAAVGAGGADAGRDRRAVPDPDAQPGQVQLPGPVAHTLRALAEIKSMDVAELCATRSRPTGRARLRRLVAVGSWRLRLLGPAEIRALAGRLDVRPTKRLGQNFVIDAGTVRRIVAWPGSSPTTWCSRSGRVSAR